MRREPEGHTLQVRWRHVLGEGVGASLPCGESGVSRPVGAGRRAKGCADRQDGAQPCRSRPAWFAGWDPHGGTHVSPAGERCECILDAALVLWAGLQLSTQGLGTDRAPPHSFPPTPQPGTHTHVCWVGLRPAPSWPVLLLA